MTSHGAARRGGVKMVERIQRWLTRSLKNERGQDMVEYAMITMFISVAIVLVTVGLLAPAFTTWANDVANCVRDTGSCTF